MSDHPGIASEDAAVYGYSLVLARGDASTATAARRELAAHRTRRDEALRLWPDAPAAPVGYTRAPDAPDSGVLLAIRLESDCCEGWRAQIAVADTPERRQFCVDALAAAAMQLARWRTLVPGAPIEPLPGFPVTP